MIWLVVTLFLAAPGSSGQESLRVFLKNGESVTGTVVSSDSNSIFLKTNKGQVRIARSFIVRLANPAEVRANKAPVATDTVERRIKKEPFVMPTVRAGDSIKVSLKDGESVTGTVVSGDSNSIFLKTNKGQVRIARSFIVRLANPAKVRTNRAPVATDTVERRMEKEPFVAPTVLAGGGVSLLSAAGGKILQLSPNVLFFPMQWIGIGVDLSLAEAKDESYVESQLAVGPKLVLSAGQTGTSHPFYLGVGYDLLQKRDGYSGYPDAETEGRRVKLAIGVLAPVARHVAIPIEFGMLFDRLGSGETAEDGTVIALGVGLVGLLY